MLQGTTGPAVPVNALPSLLSIAENALTVAHLATTDLWWASPKSSCRVVARTMQERGFDLAPVRESKPHRYVALPDVDSGGRSKVTDVAKPLGISMLVTRDLPLASAVALLAHEPYFFVLESNRLVGVVTRSDLQRPAVSMVLFSIILAAESAMNVMISSTYRQGWETDLSEGRRKKLTAVFESRRRHNTEISLLECLMLEDRIALIRKQRSLRESLGFVTSASFDSWGDRLTGTRNVLAHGGGLLDADPNPTHAIELFNDIRLFSEACWRLARRPAQGT